MEITFHGGANEVGRSCIEVKLNNKKILLDCGVKIGKVEEYPLIDTSKIPKSIVITHAHLDHAAYLVHLFETKRNSKIYSTKPTRDLMQLMLADYMRVSKNKFDNGKVLKNILTSCVPLDFNVKVKDENKITFSLHNSGHILGSAQVLIHSRKGNLLYTSDLNTRENRIIDVAERNLNARTVIIESTYGGDNDISKPVAEVHREFKEIINSVLNKNGKILIPSFAVGRAQELLILLDGYMRSGEIPPAPIYIDGMIKKALKIFRHNLIYSKKELQRMILINEIDPYKSRYVFVSERRDRIDALEEGSIFITTSGMMKGGPVMTYFKYLAEDKNNLLLFVGYQAPGTPGRELLEGNKKIKYRGKEIDVKMKVKRINLSAHADRNGLINHLDSIKNLENVFIVHGEDTKRKELFDFIKKNRKNYEVFLPKNGETYEIIT